VNHRRHVMKAAALFCFKLKILIWLVYAISLVFVIGSLSESNVELQDGVANKQEASMIKESKTIAFRQRVRQTKERTSVTKIEQNEGIIVGIVWGSLVGIFGMSFYGALAYRININSPVYQFAAPALIGALPFAMGTIMVFAMGSGAFFFTLLTVSVVVLLSHLTMTIDQDIILENEMCERRS